jgi:hypothetical protein
VGRFASPRFAGDNASGVAVAALAALLAVGSGACDGGSRLRDASDARLDGSAGTDVVLEDVPPIFTDAGCDARYFQHAPMDGIHVEADAGIVWTTNPPSSGNHIGIWARWGIHTMVIPRGYWVHNLEHGGVAILYRCAGDCTALRASLEAFVRALPPEPACQGDPDAGIPASAFPRRVVLTEDPLLDPGDTVAASAWGYTYHASCLDAPSLQAFVLARTGHGPEDSCYDGFYP